MAYAILRTQKLKSAVAVHRSLKHAFREQDTPNADAERTPANSHLGASSSREAMAAFRSRLPEKHRKDAVLAIEYLMTGSPDGLHGKTRAEQDAYFRDALDWLKKRHGAENVFYAGVHRDETTPHMYAYVVPRVGDKLNCRAFLGGSKALSEMQTDFAEAVGKPHDLDRGLERSKARHTSIREFYGRVNSPAGEMPPVDPQAPNERDKADPLAYGRKVAAAVMQQIAPTWQTLEAKARMADQAKRMWDAAREAALPPHIARAKNLADNHHYVRLDSINSVAYFTKGQFVLDQTNGPSGTLTMSVGPGQRGDLMDYLKSTRVPQDQVQKVVRLMEAHEQKKSLSKAKPIGL